MLASLERPDAVILDLMLPEISGEQIFHQLRALDDSIAIVMLTGMADESVARGLLRAGRPREVASRNRGAVPVGPPHAAHRPGRGGDRGH